MTVGDTATVRTDEVDPEPMSASTRELGDRLPVEDLLALGVVVVLELALVGAYLVVTDRTVTGLRYVVYPFVWINVGLFAVARTEAPSGPARRRLVAVVVAAAYFLVLAYAAGLLRVSPGGSVGPTGLQVVLASPGWGPTVSYVATGFHLVVVPFRVVGYLALAYLGYVAVLDASGAAVSGLLGFLSCVSCTFPVVSAAVASVFGGASALSAAAAGLSVDTGTAAFVLAVGLLYYRPGFVGRSD